MRSTHGVFLVGVAASLTILASTAGCLLPGATCASNADCSSDYLVNEDIICNTETGACVPPCDVIAGECHEGETCTPERFCTGGSHDECFEEGDEACLAERELCDVDEEGPSYLACVDPDDATSRCEAAAALGARSAGGSIIYDFSLTVDPSSNDLCDALGFTGATYHDVFVTVVGGSIADGAMDGTQFMWAGDGDASAPASCADTPTYDASQGLAHCVLCLVDIHEIAVQLTDDDGSASNRLCGTVPWS